MDFNRTPEKSLLISTCSLNLDVPVNELPNSLADFIQNTSPLTHGFKTICIFGKQVREDA